MRLGGVKKFRGKRTNHKIPMCVCLGCVLCWVCHLLFVVDS